MPEFAPGVPLETSEPVVTVEGLAPGGHTFRLVVEDEDGNRSQPAFAKMTVATPPVEKVEPKVARVGQVPSPVDADHDPVGGELWVTGNASAATAAVSAAFAIDLKARKVVGSAQVPGLAGDIAVSKTADRRVGLVACPEGRAAALLSLADRKVLKVFELKSAPDGVAVAPDGTRGVAALPATGQLIVFDLVDPKVLAEIEVDRLPSKIRLSQAGRLAFVGCLGTGTVVGVDLKKLEVVGRFAVGGSAASQPVQLAATEAGFPVWTADMGASMASNALSATKIADVPLKFPPGAVAADAGGKRAFLAGPQAALLAFATAGSQNAEFTEMPAPAGLYRSVACTRDGNLAAATHPRKASVSFYLGAPPQLRGIAGGFQAPARVGATEDDRFFWILDPAGNEVALVDAAALA